MSFAEAYMQKHGWAKGKGLGKNEHGAKEAIKVYKRFDKTGVGHDVTKEYTNNWWEKAYQSAANNITLTETKGEIILKSQSKKSKKPKKASLQFGTFIKSSSIVKNGITVNESKTNIEIDIATEGKNNLPNVIPLTDEELFKACGGRTAHKGARHGVTMTAKLNRVEMQEIKLSGRVSKKNKKSKKSKKKK